MPIMKISLYQRLFYNNARRRRQHFWHEVQVVGPETGVSAFEVPVAFSWRWMEESTTGGLGRVVVDKAKIWVKGWGEVVVGVHFLTNRFV